MSGTLVKTVGFEWMLFGIALLNFVYAPLLIMLRSPPTKEEKKVCSKPTKIAQTFITRVLVTDYWREIFSSLRHLPKRGGR